MEHSNCQCVQYWNVWGGRDKMRELCSPETHFIQRLALIALLHWVLSSTLHIRGSKSYKPSLQSLLQPCLWRDLTHTYTRLLYHISVATCVLSAVQMQMYRYPQNVNSFGIS